ncbi:tail fiber domain-containing protein [Dyadobacter sandarakinus]|uniref:Tail fiber domain-containing protein n=1 Tax=Dyadobacter sandarakinus TaxID=2747268 RepID=A0ABX7I4G4_9BACT|nr:tail fiber domain-containing protein [Dyadobacter sandarakinus]QRR00734.1 tail fiber domain-containing protein [Dyadobacter sandarakinus]
MKRIFTFLFVITTVCANAQVGIGTLTPQAGLHVADSSVLFSAPGDIPGSPSRIPAVGEGRRMMWFADKAAFRAGHVGAAASTYWDNDNVGNYSFAAGQHTRASGEHAFAMGFESSASGNQSVALGSNGNASADRTLAFNGFASAVGAIALGSGAQATNDDALAMGPSSIASGLASIVLGPSIARGNFGVAIGLQNSAGGQFSMALGKNARVKHQGSVVISDASATFSSDSAYSTANNQLTMRFAGGMRLFTNQQMTSGVTLATGGGSWDMVSDRRKKENFTLLDAEQVLRKIANMPVTSWNYKAQSAAIRHVGPMAQDFYAAFGSDGIGTDTTINGGDFDGVNMAAIQALEKRTRELQQENDGLKARLEAMDAKVAAIEKLMGGPARKEEVTASR